MPGYSADLSLIHHSGFSHFARRTGPELLKLFRRSGIRGGLVVDLGCGSGVWARQLTDAGFDALGVDISPGMIRLARQTAPAARFRLGSLLDADLPPCAAVTALGEVLSYCFDPRNNKSRRQRFFHRVRRALPPGGIFAFDVTTVGMLSLNDNPRYFETGDNWAVLVQRTANAKSRRLTREISAFVSAGRCWRRTDQRHRLVLFEARELRAELEASGFNARIGRCYGRYEINPGRIAVIATAS